MVVVRDSEDFFEREGVACDCWVEEFRVCGGSGGFFVVGADFLADVAAVEAAGFCDDLGEWRGDIVTVFDREE